MVANVKNSFFICILVVFACTFSVVVKSCLAVVAAQLVPPAAITVVDVIITKVTK